MSSGLRNALGEGASWLVAAVILIGGVVYHNEVRLGLYAFMGIEIPSEDSSAAAPVATPRVNEAERRIQQAEARAAEAEARARAAEAQARGQHSASIRPQTQSRPRYGNIVELPASRDGHYYAKAELNGSPVNVLVDTGATMVALTYEDAQRAGIHLSNSDFTGRAQTANGIARFAPVTIDQITIGNVTVRDVRGSVAEPGRMSVTLLGMSFLGKLIRSEMRSGVLVLEN